MFQQAILEHTQQNCRITSNDATDIDQSSDKLNTFEMYQGIANLAPNGPSDGGLCVLRGSHLRHEEYFAATGGIVAEQAGHGGYKYRGTQIQWYKDNGCEEIKICAGEGDLIGEEYPQDHS